MPMYEQNHLYCNVLPMISMSKNNSPIAFFLVFGILHYKADTLLVYQSEWRLTGTTKICQVYWQPRRHYIESNLGWIMIWNYRIIGYLTTLESALHCYTPLTQAGRKCNDNKTIGITGFL